MSTEKYNLAVKYSGLSKNLKEIKKSRRFGNYKKMAGLLGITHQYLSDIIRFRKEPSDLLLNSMASIFGIPREKLLAEEALIVAEPPGFHSLDPARKKLVDKVKRLVLTAEDDVINALSANVDQFQQKADIMREIEYLKKK